MHAWACRDNKSTKKMNRKVAFESSEIEQEKSYTDAPPRSISSTKLELLVAKKYHDHVFLQVYQHTGEEIDSNSEKEEDSRFLSIVSYLKIKEQKKEQNEHDKKRRGKINGGEDKENFKLQTAAANRQIDVA